MRTAALVLVACFVGLDSPVAAQSHAGALEAGDETRDGSGQYADAYTFEAAEGQRITVTMTSQAFDTYLIVRSPTGAESENDDAGGTTMSRLEVVATEGGTWTAVASSFSEGETGSYQLEIEMGGTADVETIGGRLDPQDAVTIKGEYYDTHTISVDAGTQFQVELTSLGFDGYLSVMTPSGAFHRNDDAGSIELSRIGPLTAEQGEYTIYVTTAGPGAVGAYDLRILRFE